MDWAVEMEKLIVQACRLTELEYDDNGQIVIYTGMKHDDNGKIVEIES